VSEADLRAWVKWFSVPRHFEAQPAVNRESADVLAGLFRDWGYEVSFQGEYYNVVALPAGVRGPMQLVGAHFDSTAFTPGADDNASAIAAMLGCAKVLATVKPALPVMFVSFNREEDWMLGSGNFVEKLSERERREIACAHILEMVGYTDHAPNSQRVPPGLPIKVPTTGDFLGLLANGDSARELEHAMQTAKACMPDFTVISLRTMLGLEKQLPVLLRSDHAPFWAKGIPALMWTDTSEFRNPHYHRDSDLPETLDYAFLRRVTQLLIATVVGAAKHE
jgi:Zn-dependent M28 family amino/carboxypeptidase